jgi:archaellum biogenesis ATPase FlaH
MKGKCKIISIKTLKNKQYETINLGDEYNALFGTLQSRFVMMCYGPSGSGKSVFALRLAARLAKEGKVLYNSHEEKDNKTLQDRTIEFEIEAPRLFIGVSLDFDQMVAKIKSNHYHFIVIDSVQYMAFTYDQLIALGEVFKRKKKFGVIMVSFGNTAGNPDRAKELLHASDVKCFFKNGGVNVVSRYLKNPVGKLLFSTRNTNQLSLFQ